MDWNIIGPLDDSNSQVIRVIRSDGAKGFAKPAFKDGVPQGAIEKIASELGRIVELPISEIELVELPVGDGLFAISIQPFKIYAGWKSDDNIPYDLIEKNEEAMFNKAYVFQMWIGDSDHSKNGQNLIVGRNAESENWRIQFFDYANSLVRSWDFFKCVALSGEKTHLGASNPQEQADAASIINEICIDDISRIIASIDPRFREFGNLDRITTNLVCLKRPLMEKFARLEKA